jgi:hypothetical protein
MKVVERNFSKSSLMTDAFQQKASKVLADTQLRWAPDSIRATHGRPGARS